MPPTDVEVVAAAFRQLLTDEAKRAEMGRAGRMLVESYYNWDRVARDTREFTHQFLRSSAAGIEFVGSIPDDFHLLAIAMTLLDVSISNDQRSLRIAAFSRVHRRFARFEPPPESSRFPIQMTGPQTRAAAWPIA